MCFRVITAVDTFLMARYIFESAIRLNYQWGFA